MKIPDTFRSRPPATPESLASLRNSLPDTIPPDYYETLALFDGGEGFVGSAYIAIYSAQDVLELNRAYHTDHFAPGLVIFGSDRGGDAFAFDTRKRPTTLVTVPFIPLLYAHCRVAANSLSSLLTNLAADTPEEPPQPNPRTFGKEVHEITPIVFGGSPLDPANKVLLEPAQHPEYVVYWNNLYKSLAGA